MLLLQLFLLCEILSVAISTPVAIDTDTTGVDKPPPKTEIDPVGANTHKKLDFFHGNSRDSAFDSNKKSRMKRGATKTTWRWPKVGNEVTIPFVISSGVSSGVKKSLRTVVRQLRQDTCINLEERDSAPSGNEYAIIKDGIGCSSDIGDQTSDHGRPMAVTLQSRCADRGTIAHEIMHLLGFFHEHTREDRDQYITVYEDNIEDGYESEFETKPQNNFNYPYDKKSIMQYSGTTFGKVDSDGTRAVTMRSKSDPNEKLGAVSHMDAMDLGKINAFYGCSSAPTFVDHTITLTTGNDLGAGTDGYVYLKLVGSSGTTPWQLVTSGGEYADENERGDVQTHYIPFPDVGSISSVKVALVAEGDFPSEKKKRSTETDQKLKRWFWNTNGWTLSDVKVDGVSYGGGDMDEGDKLTLNP